MATRIYLHRGTDSTSGLPTTEQSSAIASYDYNLSSLATNYVMNDIINSGQAATHHIGTNLARSNGSTYQVYIARWVGKIKATATQINSNTWNMFLAGFGGNGDWSFPFDSNKKTHVNLYVWRPSTTSKVGTIIDGLSDTGTGNNNNRDVAHYFTFSGSAVSGIQNGDYLVLELWCQATSSSGAGTGNLSFEYDGDDETFSAGFDTADTAAAYIETPQDAILSGPTKFYFHDTLSSVSGTLPSAEQATDVTSISASADAQTVNRTMNTTIGTSQTSKQVTLTNSTSLLNYYFTRFVSEPLPAQTIPAQTWTYNFATAESALAANAPVSGTNKAIMVICYVWRPSTGAKVADIANGTGISSTTYSEPSSANIESSQHGTFSGSSVTTQAGDVLCIEIIFDVQMGSTGNGRTFTFYYDGTTETASTRTSVSNHASYLGTSQEILFGSVLRNLEVNIGTQSITLTDSRNRLKNLNRARSDSVNLTDAESRLRNKIRLRSDSVTLSESLSRLRNKSKLRTDSLTLNESVYRISNRIRSFTQGLTVLEGVSRTTIRLRTVSDSLTFTHSSTNRLRLLLQTIPDSFNISESISKDLGDRVRLISDNIQLLESISRLKSINRSVSGGTVSFSEGITHIRNKIRNFSNSIILSESISRITNRLRIISQGIMLSESNNRIRGKMGILSETMGFSDDLPLKLTTRLRTVLEDLSFNEIISRFRYRPVQFENSISLSESIQRTKNILRLFSNSITLSESILVFRGYIRTIIDETIGFTDSSFTRLRGLSKDISQDTIQLEDNLQSIVNRIREIQYEITLSHTFQKLTTRTRGFTNSITLNHLFITGSAKIKEIFESIEFIDNPVSRLRELNRNIPEEIISLQDTIESIRNKLRVFQNDLTFSSYLERLITKLRGFTDDLSLSDLIETVGADLVRTISETLDFDHTTSRVKNIMRSSTYSLSFDHITSRLTTRLREFVDEISLTDAIDRTIEFVKTLNHELSFSASQNRAIHRLRSLSQTLSLTSTVSHIRLRLKSISQELTLSDSFIQIGLSALIKNIDHELGISDNIQRARGFSRNIGAQTISFSESVSRMRVSILREFNQSLIFSDTVGKFRSQITKIISDNLAFSSSIFRTVRSAIKSFSLKIRRYKLYRYN